MVSSVNDLNAALESLLTDRSPRSIVIALEKDDQAMLRMAQIIRGSLPVAPRPEFVVQMMHQFQGASHSVTYWSTDLT